MELQSFRDALPGKAVVDLSDDVRVAQTETLHLQRDPFRFNYKLTSIQITKVMLLDSYRL